MIFFIAYLIIGVFFGILEGILVTLRNRHISLFDEEPAVLLATITGFLWPLFLGFLMVSFIYRKYIAKHFNRFVNWLDLKIYGDTE